MANSPLTGPRVSALQFANASGEKTNDGCHGNLGGVEPNDRVIIPNVRVMVICWGKFYQDHPDAADNAILLCRDLVTGPYLNGLAQYGIGRGSLAGSVNINFALPPNTLSEDEARDTLIGWLQNNVVLAPAINEGSLLYVIFLPPETKPSISSGQDDFCGYHHWAKLHDESKNSDVYWALIRTDSADQKDGASFVNSVSYCVSHEIAEALTSPDGRGFHKGACEIGDLCEQNGNHSYRGWQVEQYWSQWDGTCVNGEASVSLRHFLDKRGIAGNSLRALHTSTINVEYIASQFRLPPA